VPRPHSITGSGPGETLRSKEGNLDMAKEMTWRKAIDKVLGSSPTPLHYNDIAERIISEGLRKNPGATPAATVSAQISASIKHDGASSLDAALNKL
jgi:hypothetical protein